ncbi:unnamed protein product, partial [Symbiodinium sp. CCMP2456]
CLAASSLPSFRSCGRGKGLGGSGCQSSGRCSRGGTSPPRHTLRSCSSLWASNCHKGGSKGTRGRGRRGLGEGSRAPDAGSSGNGAFGGVARVGGGLCRPGRQLARIPAPGSAWAGNLRLRSRQRLHQDGCGIRYSGGFQRCIGRARFHKGGRGHARFGAQLWWAAIRSFAGAATWAPPGGSFLGRGLCSVDGAAAAAASKAVSRKHGGFTSGAGTTFNRSRPSSIRGGRAALGRQGGASWCREGSLSPAPCCRAPGHGHAHREGGSGDMERRFCHHHTHAAFYYKV